MLTILMLSGCVNYYLLLYLYYMDVTVVHHGPAHLGGGISEALYQTERFSPGLWVISQDIEEGVDAGFELPGSKNVGEMGNIAFPPVREWRGQV